ncbi:MAG: DNA-processing protein DprA [Sporichthyaceae bacterium]|nr:DNA-processing protein DprA [Sporichthyaceae bacterium]
MDGLIVDSRGARMLAGGSVVALPRRPADDLGVDERYARAALSRLVEPVDKSMVGLVERYGAVTVFADLRSGVLQHDRARHWRARLGRLDVEEDLRQAAELGGRLVCPGDAEWPPGVDDLGARRPLALWVRGRQSLTEVLAQSVAVVGSRAATSYGSHVGAELGAELCDRGWTVVSGAAYGIDACAHKGALAAGGRTVAVLACGVDVTYPAGHRALLERVAEEGAIVSELPPREAPMRGRFLVRNRLIAAMTRGTVVVEASPRSGALNTAGEAIALYRPVLAVPGPVTSAMSAGVHQLVRKGMAELVTNAAEVIEVVGRIGEDLAPEVRGPVRQHDRLGPDVARVLDAMPVRAVCEVEAIATRAGLAADTVLAGLETLVEQGWVEEVLGGWRRIKK